MSFASDSPFAEALIECLSAFDLLTRAGWAPELVVMHPCDAPDGGLRAAIAINTPGGRMSWGVARLAEPPMTKAEREEIAVGFCDALRVALPKWNALPTVKRRAVVEASAIRQEAALLLASVSAAAYGLPTPP